MGTHTNHTTLEGYDPERLLQDGCSECEHRGADPLEGLAHLDAQRFAKAWRRAADWQRDRLPGRQPVSVAEAPMLRVLWQIQLLFERFGYATLGQLPGRLGLDEALRVAVLHKNVQDDDSDLSKRLTVLERPVVELACSAALGGWGDLSK